MVARTAGQVCVRAVQCKFCPGVVIELPELPVIRVMAGIALCSEAALVRVFVSMAIDAAAARILEPGRQVARFTRYQRVKTNQRKAGEIMIEIDIVIPA